MVVVLSTKYKVLRSEERKVNLINSVSYLKNKKKYFQIL
jgi:hypothetical protein